jgi:hypothetical protein
MNTQRVVGMLIVGCAAVLMGCEQPQTPVTEDPYATIVDAQGNIIVPTNYRTRYAHLGSWTITDSTAPERNGIHDVYTQPEMATAYRTSGAWPDGTILVKDIRDIVYENLTTGPATYSGDQKVWFVMVKDTRNRFPSSIHWQNGWGWGLFNAGNPGQNVSRGFAQECESCHVPAQATDWVYVRGYPTLRNQ